MLTYLTDAVVATHTTIIHDDIHIFTGHRAYIEDLEAYLQIQGGGQFVPLPKWDPATQIPPEFNVVRAEDDGTPRPPLVNLNPNRPPPEFAPPAVCNFTDGNVLGDTVNPWHGDVHVTVGGTMGFFSIASAAPIFWCWHGYVDSIYDDWLACQAPPTGWMSLGGILTSKPAVGRNADGRLEVFARGTDNALYHIWQTAPNNGWSDWGGLGGILVADPAVGQNADGRLEVFARGTDNALYHIWQTAPNNGWSDWGGLGGILVADPAVGQNADGRLEAFGTGTDGALYHTFGRPPPTTAGRTGRASAAS